MVFNRGNSAWFENVIYFGPCKIPMRPRMQPGDYIFGISPSNGTPRKIIFSACIAERLTYAQAFARLPKLRGPDGPIHVRPTQSPGLGFPESHYEHIPDGNHADSWRDDLRTPELDAFFTCVPASGVLGRWFGASGPTLNDSILRFLRACDVYGAGGRRLGKNVFGTASAPVAHGRLYRGLHLETEDPNKFLRLVTQAIEVRRDTDASDAEASLPVVGRRKARTYHGCSPKSQTKRRVLFVRVGADQTPGGGSWNAPIDPTTNEFVYVPIPETKQLRPGLETSYSTVAPALSRIGSALPAHLTGRHMHLDPDFEFNTYGDRGSKGAQLSSSLHEGDLLVFYSGLRSLADKKELVYAIIGVLSVRQIVKAVTQAVPSWRTNAHTRRQLTADADDIVVVGDPNRSGRLGRAIPIGEFRAGAYRVSKPLLEAWGGITSRDGFLQRSAVFPAASDPGRFLQWWDAQAAQLIRQNNPASQPVSHRGK